MIKKVFVYDPTVSDLRSAVRGVGRYLQILKENFKDDFEFISDIENCSPRFAVEAGKLKIENSIFINPFFNFLQKPVILKRITKKQIAVIHDLIPLKYPSNFPVGIKGAIYILLNKLALKNYDLIITDSEASKVDIIKILEIEENKIKVIYPCLPNSFLKLGIKNLDLNKNSKFKIKNYCLYVGDATWNKNLVNLAKAIKLANVNCVFVGKVFENCLPAGKAGKL
jgi:glycosyltransferase involved in cell wall biosynthesis